MSSQDEINEIVVTLRNAISSAINEKQSEITIEIKDLSRIDNIFIVIATFRVSPFLGGRTGQICVALNKTEQGFSIRNLKITERRL